MVGAEPRRGTCRHQKSCVMRSTKQVCACVTWASVSVCVCVCVRVRVGVGVGICVSVSLCLCVCVCQARLADSDQLKPTQPRHKTQDTTQCQHMTYILHQWLHPTTPSTPRTSMPQRRSTHAMLSCWCISVSLNSGSPNSFLWLVNGTISITINVTFNFFWHLK